MTKVVIDQTHVVETPSILLVDDEANVLSSLRRLFRKLNCTIYIANSGQEGLDTLKEHAIDVIISDARMPEMTGPEFLAIAAETYPDTTRILLTGYADMSAIVDAVNRGKVSHYVEKPWDDERLIALVESALTNTQLKKQNAQLQRVVQEQNTKLKALNDSLEATVKERSSKIIQINENLKENYRNVIDLFAGLLDMRQPKSEIHVPDIVSLVRDMGTRLQMTEKDVDVLQGAAKMRYIGQVCLSDEILKIPYETLTPEQKEEYEQYPMMGSTLLTCVRQLWPMAEVILQHKEYLNGKGFPNGDWEKFISRKAQVLAVANDYIELMNGRMLAEPLTHVEALRYLSARVGDYYAADIVETLKSVLSTYQLEEPINDQRIWSKQLVPGMVLSRNLENHKGAFLLSKGHVLTAHIIEKLVELEQQSKAEFKFFVIVPEGVIIPDVGNREIKSK